MSDISDIDKSSFDTADVEDVLQTDDDDTVPVVPVSVENAVRVDELPTETVMFTKILRAGEPPEKILQYDPKRKRAILSPFLPLEGADNDGILVSTRKGDCDQFVGALIHSENAISRWSYTGKDELWARAITVQDTAGIFTGIVTAATDRVLSLIVEQWTR